MSVNFDFQYSPTPPHWNVGIEKSNRLFPWGVHFLVNEINSRWCSDSLSYLNRPTHSLPHLFTFVFTYLHLTCLLTHTYSLVYLSIYSLTYWCNMQQPACSLTYTHTYLLAFSPPYLFTFYLLNYIVTHLHTFLILIISLYNLIVIYFKLFIVLYNLLNINQTRWSFTSVSYFIIHIVTLTIHDRLFGISDD